MRAVLPSFLLAAAVMIACTDEPSSPEASGLTARYGKASSTTDMTVNAAVPDSATQDTTLDVVINGSGFVAGTVATWALAGVADPNQVRTNSTRYVNSRQLVANVTISATATLGKWDIAVAASGKKGGIGTESFAIKQAGKPIADDTPDFYVSNGSEMFLTGDEAASYLAASGPYPGTTRYSNNVCGTTTTLWDSPSDNRSGDAILNTSFIKALRCAEYPRKVRIRYAPIGADGSASIQSSALRVATLLVDAVQAPNTPTGLIYIPIGTTELRAMNISDDVGVCNSLRFRPVLKDGTITGADKVLVSRTDASTWIVQSQADQIDAMGRVIHHDKAWCQNTGALYHLPLKLIFHNQTPVTP